MAQKKAQYKKNVEVKTIKIKYTSQILIANPCHKFIIACKISNIISNYTFRQINHYNKTFFTQ